MANSATPTKRRSSTMVFILGLPVLLVCIVLFKATVALLLLGMLPSIVAYYADTTEERMAMLTITVCNIAGVMPYAVDMFFSGGTWDLMAFYLRDFTMWLVCYGLAGLGYLLIKLCPLAYYYVAVALNSSVAFRLQQRQDSLIHEWGPEIAEESEIPESLKRQDGEAGTGPRS